MIPADCQSPWIAVHARKPSGSDLSGLSLGSVAALATWVFLFAACREELVDNGIEVSRLMVKVVRDWDLLFKLNLSELRPAVFLSMRHLKPGG